MSRFYDALTEASRSAAVAAKLDEATDVEHHPAPPAENCGVSRDDACAVKAAHEAVEVNGSGKAAGVSSGALAQIRFDPAARLLPNSARSVVVEQYRRLRTKIFQERASNAFCSVAITSPEPQSGKTVTALNLALSCAMLPNCRVLLVDGDLRRGAVGAYLGLESRPGLSDAIEGTVRLEDAIVRSNEISADFLLRGNSKIPPAELLFSEAAAAQFRKMREGYDLVIVDTPPITLVADTQMIVANCDGVILVVRAFSTSRKALEKATQDLNSARIIGAVLNGGTRAQVYRGYGGYY